MKRLVCIVEGRGEVVAIPNLCARILKHVGSAGWVVDNDPIRQPRSSLVDESSASPNRPPTSKDLPRALELAVRRPADAVLVLCDSDDDCAAFWGPLASTAVSSRIVGAGVMAVREYEGWLLHNQNPEELRKFTKKSPEEIRGAKGYMGKFVPGYKPTTHQLQQTRLIDIDLVASKSQSFYKFVRAVASICGASYKCPSI